MSGALLSCEGLSVDYGLEGAAQRAVEDLSFHIDPGEALGLVGESGCGKTTVALAVTRYLGPNGRISGGTICFEGRDLASLSGRELRHLRGARIAMVYQDPQSSLNPVMTIGQQLMEVPLLHRTRRRSEARELAVRALAEVELPDPEAIMARYPHQLSGGQQQRAVIAMALIAEPSLLIMDEPTTGLDVTVEAAVLALVDRLRRRHGMSVLFISHNLGSIGRLCDRVGVLYAGRLVELGPLDQVFANPRHPYTRGLLECVPSLADGRRSRQLTPIAGALTNEARNAVGCAFADRCAHAVERLCTGRPIVLEPVDGEPGHAVRCILAERLPPFSWTDGGAAATDHSRPSGEPVLSAHGLGKSYAIGGGRAALEALRGIDLDLERGSTLAIVGESGSGKSTFARIVIGLTDATQGELHFQGKDIAHLPISRRPRDLRQRLQMIFQNPDGTLNPSHSVGYALERTIGRLHRIGRAQSRADARKLLQLVQLPADFAERLPEELSGGQRQRVAIARALAAAPDIVIADEPVSALDVSVQAAIANLLKGLQARHSLSLVFISHDIALVRYMADHVALFYRGRLVELGPVDAVFAPPYHPYTQMLLASVSDPSAPGQHAQVREAGTAGSQETARGCPFAARCAWRIDRLCERVDPPILEPSTGHRIACHLDVAELPRTIEPAA
jgi:peptide/nickel transport system ATP-binding protein